MNIKIGKFNFVNSEKEILYLNDSSLSNKLQYFFMDGKEDTIFVNDRSVFDTPYQDIGKFEKDLLKNHYVIEYSSLIKNLINKFTKSKAIEIYMNNQYSKYNLYKNTSIGTIQNLEKIRKCDFFFRRSINNDNKLIVHANYDYDIVFDPYNEKIDNLEELYEKGVFNKEIKANLILLEIEDGVAPKFVEELTQINKFFENKKTVNLKCNGFENFKVDAKLDSLFELRNNEISIKLKNQSENEEKMKIENLREFSYNNNSFRINYNNLINIPKQIAITLNDKIEYKIDQIKNTISQEFSKEKIKLEFENYSLNMTVPSTVEQAISTIREIENSSIEKNFNYPNWYTDEMKEILQKEELLNELINSNGQEKFISIGRKLAYICNDHELDKIVNEYENNKNIYMEIEENNEEEEDCI